MKQKGLAPILIVLLIALGIGGYLIYQKQIKPVTVPQQTTQSVPAPTSNPESTSSAETANWKTYTNTKYFYQIKYPSSWKEKVADNNVVILSPKNEVVYVNYNVNPQKLTLEQSHKQNWPDKTFEELTISGKKAIKSELGFYNVLLNDGGYLNISYDGCYGTPCEASESLKQTFDQIISTFKFTN